MLVIQKRVMGIEPTYPAWKAGVLPLNYTRVVLTRTYNKQLLTLCQAIYFKLAVHIV